MTVLAPEVVVLARDGDATAVVDPNDGFNLSAFHAPAAALHQVAELRAKNLPVVFVMGRSDVNRAPILLELSTRYPDVPVVIATDDAARPSAATSAVAQPARSRALTDAIADASRSAAQRARVRTTLDRLNVRISSYSPAADPAQQKRLLLSRLYLDSLLQQAHDAMFVADRAGVVALWNPAAERVFEVPASAIVGQSLATAGRQVGQPLFDAARALSPDRPVISAPLAFAVAKGRREVDVTLSLISDAGQAIAVAGVGRDMTAERELQRRLEERAKALAESNRHKDEFLAILSHELRTPLNVVLGWAHILDAKAADPKGIRQAVAVIKRNAELQQRLVEDLLDYARIVAGRLELQLDLLAAAEFVRLSLESLKPAVLGAALTLHERYDTDRNVRVDADRMRQVLVNLVMNSMKFTPPGGEIRVSVTEGGGWVQIAVSDTGAGIAPEFLPHVFDEFRQGNAPSTRQKSGLGLGLSITRRIVQLHGGTIEARSAGIGQGAEFVVRLPMDSAEAAETPAP